MSTEETLVSSRIVYEGRIFRVRLDQVRKAHHQDEHQREIVEHPDAVVGVVLTSATRILLVEQYRRAPEKMLLELPAGKVDPGETLEEACVREVIEECGVRPRKLEKLSGFYASPGFCTEKMHVYLCSDLEDAKHGVNEGEIDQLHEVELADAVARVRQGEFEDGKTVVGVLLAAQRLGLTG
ncbi:MAG: NUDIX hydrolase [Candidatus Xenobia bacterium]